MAFVFLEEIDFYGRMDGFSRNFILFSCSKVQTQLFKMEEKGPGQDQNHTMWSWGCDRMGMGMSACVKKEE